MFSEMAAACFLLLPSFLKSPFIFLIPSGEIGRKVGERGAGRERETDSSFFSPGCREQGDRPWVPLSCSVVRCLWLCQEAGSDCNFE